MLTSFNFNKDFQIAGCPAAEKVLSLNKNYSDNSGCFESYVDNLKIDESMMDSSCCDDKFEVVSSPVVTVISDRLPVSSLTSSTSVIASTAVSTVTTSNSISGGGCGGNGKTISNLVNLHPNLPKLDIHCHNNANNNNSRSTGRQSDLSSTIANNVSLIPSNSIVITAGVAPIAAATMMSTTASLGLITSSSCNEDHNNRLTSTTTTTSTTRRPSTLLPALSTSSAQPLDVLKAQRQALAKVADGMNQVIPSLSSNATSCFWSSADLQNLSPILTPSTWKLLKNLTSTSNNNTNNSGSGSSSSNNSSIQQSFLVTPTLSPLYSALPTQTFASLTSMESLRSLSNNNNNNINNNSISVPVNDGSNPLSDVNNNSNNSLSVNPILIGSQNSNVSLLLSSSKVAFGNCDNNNNNNNNNNTRKSESSHTITTTTTTTTTTITSTTTTNGNNNSSISITDELSRSIQIQQSTQLNAQ
ncbi:unnamed protein product [Heterobilharzia americana]|nr:unnamed protein product [Heterobilharzia americana]